MTSTRLFYLSFADQDKPEGRQWLGACYIESESDLEAVSEAHRLGCNPGGEVMMIQMPDGITVRAGFANRLLTTHDEVAEAVGDPAGSCKTLEELGGLDFDGVVPA